LVLPFLGEGALHQQYQFDVPWDDPNNVAILDKMPQIYRDPFSENDNQRSRNRVRIPIAGHPPSIHPNRDTV